MAYELQSEVRNCMRGPVAVLESTIHARAISWWERRQCLRWRALLKRRQGGFVIAWSRRWLQARPRGEIAADNNRLRCWWYATVADTAGSMIASSIYEWMTTPAPSMNWSASVNFTNHIYSHPTRQTSCLPTTS